MLALPATGLEQLDNVYKINFLHFVDGMWDCAIGQKTNLQLL